MTMDAPILIDSRLPEFRNLSPRQRLDHLEALLQLPELQHLGTPGALPLEVANGMIENVLGTFELPYAVASNFVVNGRELLVPMVVEEPSIVAAASYMAKLARAGGGFQTSSSAPLMRAQVQLVGLGDPFNARLALLRHKDEIVELANRKDQLLNSLGGGCRDLEVHCFADSPRGPMLVAHLIVDVRDAMGANTVNTMAEAVAPLMERITGGQARLRILSNLADLRLARAQVRIAPQQLQSPDYSGEAVIEGILDAHCFAAVDPYRAATHNKGIMNGIDPLIVATGNDWRAVEAGAHAYACRSGHYGSLSTWEKDAEGHLVGSIEMPMPVGLVGGATRTHPLAQLSLRILAVHSAQELAEIAVAVGLAQNLGALRALACEGIQRGHMALHARNIALVAGARGEEVDWLARRLVEAGDVRADRAVELLRERRGA
ncbi:hydroxymethylglutaryl-CoA reductase, degradative [Pseudomonas citronellolis]|uniref:hydroxymethylglutaryl-CoA reductase, degradative n=1 Tax=Pseudomonas citronellolis TaxID=53408 RepID=UPI002649B44B|nr:hydroxymethylglutaryl-CoA reductase, degradative [Pseudomonas citronellolis]MDN6875843.1 hydroxymethylglutaryl-CoA reductase, degradative [Pseudomonas citronellolis]